MDTQPWTGPLFIVGLPRSGTKLLRTVLNNHPKIQIPTIETGFLPFWISEWESFGDLSDYEQFQQFYRQSIRLPYFRYQKERGNLIDPRVWFEASEEFTARGVFEALARHDAGALHEPDMIWGDKSPSYVRYIETISNTFPSARFIHIIRDARDYALSIQNAWGKNKIRAAQRWADSIALARSDSENLQDRYIEIRYEDLLQDPSSTLSKLCEFLDIEYYPKMQNLNQPSENIGRAKGQSKIVRENTSRYLDLMRYRDLYAIESVSQRYLRELGYTLETAAPESRVPDFRMKVYQLLDGIYSLVFRIKQIGITAAFKQWFSGLLLITRMRKVRNAAHR